MRFYILESTFHSDPLYLFFSYQAKYHRSGLVFCFVCNNLGGQKLNYFLQLKSTWSNLATVYMSPEKFINHWFALVLA